MKIERLNRYDSGPREPCPEFSDVCSWTSRTYLRSTGGGIDKPLKRLLPRRFQGSRVSMTASLLTASQYIGNKLLTIVVSPGCPFKSMDTSWLSLYFISPFPVPAVSVPTLFVHRHHPEFLASISCHSVHLAPFLTPLVLYSILSRSRNEIGVDEER